jgi:SAM-dependent methyltransferase
MQVMMGAIVKNTVRLLLLVTMVLVGQADDLLRAEDDISREQRVYLEFRRWINSQAEEVRGGNPLAAYRKHLAGEGLQQAEIAERVAMLESGQSNQEVELWNRVLTAEEPRFNTEPNEFLVRTIRDHKPGRALDVGMGQGRNAIWLAQQGWDVTGFDPADKAVGLARELAGKAGVEIHTETVGSEQFDWGEERWDLIVMSYVSAREWIDTVGKALRPGGWVVLEAFHDDATRNSSIGRGVVYETNELLELFVDFRILHYEDTLATADFGKGETRVVRLLAQKE